MASAPTSAEHDLDAVAALVSALVVFDGHRTGFPAWNAGLDTLLFERIPEPFGVITLFNRCARPVVHQAGMNVSPPSFRKA
jgi:hypothetical protein